MSLANGCVTTCSDFFRTAYDAAKIEPLATKFKEFSQNGDREGMIKLLMEVPCIRVAKVAEFYRGKNDAEAAELYAKARETMMTGTQNGERHEDSGRACSFLDEALFAASANSRLFLDALLDCAKYWYGVKAFAKCLRYCECMLALPASFYDDNTETRNCFLECRKECVHLESECSKVFRASQKKKARGNHNASRSFAAEKNAVTTPPIDGKQHATLESCSDAVALQFNEQKGRHLVASRNIKAGSVLIVDRPFSTSMGVEALGRNCLHCKVTLKTEDSVKIPCRRCRTVSFCSEKCRREAWQSYHRYECSIFNFFCEGDSKQQQLQQAPHLLLAYRTTIAGGLSPIDRKDDAEELGELQIPSLNESFLRYHSGGSNKEYSRLEPNEIYSSQDYRTVVELETHCASIESNVNLLRSIEAIFLTKCFTFVLSKMDLLCSRETFISLAVATLHHLQAINCNAYEIVENVYDETTRIWEPRYVGGAIYPAVSLVNHSCYPNTVRHSYPFGIVVVRTLQFIRKGTEILDCYGPHFLSEARLTRREYLWKKYRFLCACAACTENWQYPLPETMNYKCRSCSEVSGARLTNKNDTRKVTTQCSKCHERTDRKKLEAQYQKSVKKRLSAITKMYQRQYEEALPLLLEHMYFIEKFFAVPNIETIKTQQCIIQCYNHFGCIGH